MANNQPHQLVDGMPLGIEDQVRILGRMVYAVVADKGIDLPVDRLLVESLRVPLGTGGDGARDIADRQVGNSAANMVAGILSSGQCGHDNMEASLGRLVREVRQSRDHPQPIIGSKCEVRSEQVAYLVAVEADDMHSDLSQIRNGAQSQRRFAGGGRPHEPEHCSAPERLIDSASRSAELADVMVFDIHRTHPTALSPRRAALEAAR